MSAPSPAIPEPRVLAARVAALVEASADRVLIGIAGAPGAGKTTLAQAVVEAVDRERGGRPGAFAVHLPMDGFHLANATLDRLGRRERKGAIETFDAWGFVALLARIRTETDHPVYAPSFERSVDEPIAGELAVEASVRVVVVEGNYLLDDREPWPRVRTLLDEAWYCETSEAERTRRLVDRHTRHGRSRAAAEAWAREVDEANAREIEAARGRADLVVSGETGAILG